MTESKGLERLQALEGRSLGPYRVGFQLMERGRYVDERNFALHLRRDDGAVSVKPVVFGKYFAGRQPWLKDWFDVYYLSTATFQDGAAVDLGQGLDLELFELIYDCLEPGGKIFVAYTVGPHEKTEQALTRGFPAAATPLGHLLWRAGFRWFKNWYFPEGWREGGPKIQANKPLNAEVGRKLEEHAAAELLAFIDEPPASPDVIEREARERATQILSRLGDQSRRSAARL